MELKDVILSTLDEIEKDSKEDNVDLKEHIKNYKENAAKTPLSPDEAMAAEGSEDELDLPPFLRQEQSLQEAQPQKEQKQTSPSSSTPHSKQQTEREPLHKDEIKYLETVREKVLVLFEGFQSPNNKKLEAKLDLTINFLEYFLSTLDERLDKLRKE